jgi:hypothetical protein
VRRALPILAEAALILCTIGLILACWMPIDAVRHWFTGP